VKLWGKEKKVKDREVKKKSCVKGLVAGQRSICEHEGRRVLEGDKI